MNVILGNMVNAIGPVVIILLPFGHLSRIDSSVVAKKDVIAAISGFKSKTLSWPVNQPSKTGIT
jgi:hypothetical protein